MLTCCLGDLVLDVIVRLEQPLATGADATSRIVLRPGGQAANVAAWVAHLGGRARLISKRGDDETGHLAAARLGAYGVELVGPLEPEGTGVIVALVSPSGDRTMCTDRGVAPELRADEVEPAWIDGCDHLHVSGYALLRDPIRLAAVRLVELARERGAAVSVDLSSWSAIRDFGPARFRRLVEQLAPDIVFANLDEEAVVGGRVAGPSWILKRGAAGASFDGTERPALPVAEVIDSTGAGDALAAGYIVGGPELALAAAAACIQSAGSMPGPGDARPTAGVDR